MGLRPWEVWRHTPAEFALAAEAFRDRQQRERVRDAWVLANLLQPWSRERLKVSDFLPGEQKGESDVSQHHAFQRLIRG